LKIIDRKKNIFKLSQGEYVAPEKIESVFSTCKFVMQSFVYGDSFRDHLVAIIVPNPDTLKDWSAKHLGGAAKGVDELCKSVELKKAILAELVSISRSANFNGFEIVKNIFIEPNMWTTNDLLTPTFKLKRADAATKYKSRIDHMYNEDSAAKL
jgi:long-chain acyl-CoA synthetase